MREMGRSRAAAAVLALCAMSAESAATQKSITPTRLVRPPAAGPAAIAASSRDACTVQVSVCSHQLPSAFALIDKSSVAKIVIDQEADSAVQAAAQGFADDVTRVAGLTTAAKVATRPTGERIVLIGVAGHSALIDQLAAKGLVAIDDLRGKWETYRQVVVSRPFPGVKSAIVIVGSDRRGAVFGAYDLSEKIGVSPWAWWADVPVVRRPHLYITAGVHNDAPKVRYRGLFINDEEPAFGTWARAKFGGINSKLYAHVFDLILRLKGNYLWPAMWGKAIGADDPATMPLADARGVVLGTSHHEPMTRAQEEWHRDQDRGVTGGKWDYVSNAANLRAFWRGGIERMMSKGDGHGYEQLVTVGMRGDGDEPMGEGTATALLEHVVHDQRAIISEVTKRPENQTPQVWALYKEVQDYYDHGMRVPDDVTLLFSDDNWGQIRRLPNHDIGRTGGYGIYYHFDYVGGPRSYKWLNTNQIAKTWQQMDLAYHSGARALWIVNVGDIKPMEYPIDFFMKMAWDPEALTPEKLAAFPREWAARNFGADHAKAIAQMVTDYSRLAAQRKPELVDADSYALGGVTPKTLDGGEFGAIVDRWRALAEQAAFTRERLSPVYRDAYYQLVEHPILALGNLYELYYAVALNRRLSMAGDRRANVFADRAEAAFARDRKLQAAYHSLNGGKWDGMMLQSHFGYTSWAEPKVDVMPAVKRIAAAKPEQTVRFAAASAALRSAYAIVDADAFTARHSKSRFEWKFVSGIGPNAGAVGTFPQSTASTTLSDAVRIDYTMTVSGAGEGNVRLHMVPTIDTRGTGGLRLGVSVDDGPMKTVTMNLKVDEPSWNKAVRNNDHVIDVDVGRLASGKHKVTLWRLDGNVFLQRLALLTQ